MGGREAAVCLVLKALRVNVARLRDFDGRRTLQKVVYLLQEGPKKWKFGFQYNLYLRGPYSPALADAGYRLLESIDSVELETTDLSLKDECIVDIQTISCAFSSPEGEPDPDLLELVATVVFLCKYTYGYLATREDRLTAAKDWVLKNKPSLARRFDEAICGLDKLEMDV